MTRLTREEYVVGERIVDHAGAGPIHMLSFEPEGTGTRLTYAWDAPRWLKALDALFVHSDKDVRNALETFQREIEARAR
ncbi:hypothetical protein [Isoptericola sp. AK164]|uniref:hypothetical protein n=1 Tax=Isoptericola sp. AK164 TaxID=3024246 RepID=UPI0024182550|nr:hypothetical protein [Isoptericola sp. AK164]